jgi:hypothetical protein
MLLAAMLAMALAAVAPALGQGDVGDVNEGDDQFNVGDETVYSAVCQNIIGALEAEANQAGFASAQALADENAAAVSEVAQEQNVSVSQVNNCLNVTAKAAAGQDAAATDTATATATDTATATATATETATATTTPTPTPTPLPPTGGEVGGGGFALLAGALLLGSGVLTYAYMRRPS